MQSWSLHYYRQHKQYKDVLVTINNWIYFVGSAGGGKKNPPKSPHEYTVEFTALRSRVFIFFSSNEIVTTADAPESYSTSSCDYGTSSSAVVTIVLLEILPSKCLT